MQTRSQRIARCLPELRRYAHALLGSRQSGDAQLRVMLEALLETPSAVKAKGDLRKELFRFFHTVVHTLQLPLDQPIDGDEMPERRLRNAIASLPPRGRETLLLTSLAGFDTTETAEVLGITVAGVQRELERAREQVRRRLSARILIVEDQAHQAARLEQMVESLGHSVVGIVPSDSEAVDAAREQRPELVIADVHGNRSAETEEQIRQAVGAPVVSVRQSQPRRAATRRTTTRSRSRRQVTARNVGDAISEALSAPAVVNANALTRG